MAKPNPRSESRNTGGSRKLPPEAPTLKELQHWMRWVITDPHGVTKALKHQRGEPKRQLSSIVEAPPLGRIKRLDVYAEAYYSRLLECLEDDFEALRRVLGENIFRRLAADYLEAHPSRSFTAAALGQHMAKFLEHWDLTESLPYLPELARFEWALVESFFAKDLPAYDLSKLAKIKAAAWGRAKLKLDSSVILLHAHWNVDELWRDDKSVAAESERYLLVRRAPVSLRAVADRLEPLQYRVLELVRDGLSLGEICEQLEEELDLAESDAALPPLMDWFRDWLGRGVIREISFSR